MSKSGKNQMSGTKPKSGTSKGASKKKPMKKSPSRTPILRWFAPKGCWRYGPTINGEEKVSYTGKGASGRTTKLLDVVAIPNPDTPMEETELLNQYA